MPPPRPLTCAQARRLAVHSTGLASPARGATPTVRRLGVLQIDSVNVLARAHHLTLLSRGVAAPHDALTAATRSPRRTLFEYWGREASLLPVETQPLWRWRMRDAESGVGVYPGLSAFRKANARFIDAVLDEVRTAGPVSAAELSSSAPSRGPWWGWSDAKRALEWLFWAGLVTTHHRRNTFERVYDLPERVLPRAVIDTPTPPRDDAQRALLLAALRARGVATACDLADALRLRPAECRARLAELEEARAIRPVAIDGWPTAWMPGGGRVPSAAPRRAVLINPFDPLIACRARTERLFGMRYRIEIYVPAAKRTHGYYVLPLLQGDRLTARVDLKADRAVQTLRVLAAHHDQGDAPAVARRLAGALHELAAALGLAHVTAARKGRLAPPLRAALAR